jgi:hypothetical protein
MKVNSRHLVQTLLLVVSFLSILGFTLLLQPPVSAQAASQIAPRIEQIGEDQGDVPPSYRLVISNSENIVFVYCLQNYAPKFGYLRNVEALQCEPM